MRQSGELMEQSPGDDDIEGKGEGTRDNLGVPVGPVRDDIDSICRPERTRGGGAGELINVV